ncbi:hypothetical protein QL285_025551 [Trifolium repens]|nr:hypothetical protein QL285_025551 [Trifolium repens]
MSIMREFLSDEGRQGVPPMEARDMVPVPWSASLSAQLLLSRKVCEKSSCMFLEKQYTPSNAEIPRYQGVILGDLSCY